MALEPVRAYPQKMKTKILALTLLTGLAAYVKAQSAPPAALAPGGSAGQNVGQTNGVNVVTNANKFNPYANYTNPNSTNVSPGSQYTNPYATH
jgi:hypothetical protein